MKSILPFLLKSTHRTLDIIDSACEAKIEHNLKRSKRVTERSNRDKKINKEKNKIKNNNTISKPRINKITFNYHISFIGDILKEHGDCCFISDGSDCFFKSGDYEINIENTTLYIYIKILHCRTCDESYEFSINPKTGETMVRLFNERDGLIEGFATNNQLIDILRKVKILYDNKKNISSRI